MRSIYDSAGTVPISDFSRGFYTTTNPHQAAQWANNGVRSLLGKGIRTSALVISFAVDRDALSKLNQLAFVRDTSDYYAFVSFCRSQRRDPIDAPPNHGRIEQGGIYDVVLGPVSVGRQRLIIQGADQISFHSGNAFRCLENSRPTVFDRASPNSFYLP